MGLGLELQEGRRRASSQGKVRFKVRARVRARVRVRVTSSHGSSMPSSGSRSSYHTALGSYLAKKT